MVLMATQSTQAPDGATLRLTRPMLYGMTAGFMSLAGTVFWTAGYIAGLHSSALLATLFVMGASAALLVIVLWFLAQLHTAQPAAVADEASFRERG
jgi:hypothetical protein